MQELTELKTSADIKRNAEYDLAIKVVDRILERQATDPIMKRVREHNKQHKEQNANRRDL
jgi:hypothetical protein